MELVFATNNKHKLQEVEQIIGEQFQLLSLMAINCHEEIPEEQDTIEGNASQKARYISSKYQVNCFADDTGLEVDALGGQPGVYSARYAGEGCSFQDNVDKMLKEMNGSENRTARFRTVISLIIDGKENLFEGFVPGEILCESRGGRGFGYDPIFQPIGFNRSFAEMSSIEKNEISHRGIAIKELANYLHGLELS
ncbi:MAG TPA: non-canonical purine NTP diphosphatase [Flavobacteriales bacterium]|nr:non-canonical purine NTP diphosphatase [Flavobacteriales bacterium]